MPTAFAEDIAQYADGGCTNVEVWLTKLEQHLTHHSLDDTQKLLTDRGITIPAAAAQGGLLLSQGEARRSHFDHFKRRLDLCQRLSIPTMVLVADFAGTIDSLALNRSIVSLSEAARWAAAYHVTLALEFQGGHPFCASLDTALALVQQCGEPNVGVCLDLFHYYKGPSKSEDLDRLTIANLAHVQLCDVAGVPRELMSDSDRIFPGEGDFQIAPVIQKLKSIGYAKAVSLEVNNPTLWSSRPRQIAELGLAALMRILTA